MNSKKIVIGFIGTEQDNASVVGERWRPTFAIPGLPGFSLVHLHLLYNQENLALAKDVMKELEEVLLCLYDFLNDFKIGEDQSYFFHMNTGSHVMRICLFYLATRHFFPAKLLQLIPPDKRGNGKSFRILDRNSFDLKEILEKERAKNEAVSLRLNRDHSKRWGEIYQEVIQVAQKTVDPILIMGSTGVGKTLLARKIAKIKTERGFSNGTFVAVNCATLRGDNAISSLFGHVKGSYTGARRDRVGLLKKADGGILFLDEIGDLGSEEQAMLLTALDENTFFPLGSEEITTSNFQLIAGTNKNLKECVQKGSFRKDLLNRIDQWSYTLPDLKNEPDLIPQYIDIELARWNGKNSLNARFSKKARARLLEFALAPTSLWEGNFRDIRKSVSRMATLAERSLIDLKCVENEINRLRSSWRKEDPERTPFPLIKFLLTHERISMLDLADQFELEGVLKICAESETLSEAGARLFQATRLRKKKINDADRLGKYLRKRGLSWKGIRKIR